MELMQSKIPYLPPDWTVARGAKYIARLAAFIFMPGLHQIACKRWIFGCLLMALYFISHFLGTYQPANLADMNQISYDTFKTCWKIAQVITWLLLILDLKNLEKYKLTFVSLLPLSGFAVMFCSSFYSYPTMLVYVEQSNELCPQFCKYDIIQFDYAYLDEPDILIGDYVIVHVRQGRHIARTLTNSPEVACAKGGVASQYLRDGNKYCTFLSLNQYRYNYLMLGHGYPADEVNVIGDREIFMVNRLGIKGIRPFKVGNTHEYFFISNGITDIVGQTLLTIYTWTGVNLFGPTNQ
jgi:hypothetical protein